MNEKTAAQAAVFHGGGRSSRGQAATRTGAELGVVTGDDTGGGITGALPRERPELR
ncbi:hypothetical protein D3C81_2243340 [compost metagenome]